MEEGESGASNKIRTTITEMGLGEDKMDEGGFEEAEGGDAENEGRRLGGTLWELEATGLLTQDADPGGTTLVDERNSFNELISLVMLRMVRHHWAAGARFAFNCYTHWEQILLRQTRYAPVILLSREGVTQCKPL